MATCNLDTLKAEACVSKFTCLDERTAQALLAQLLCNILQDGAGALTQVYTSLDADPNTAGIVPGNTTKGAIFYQDPLITMYNEWKWSVATQTWIQTIAP